MSEDKATTPPKASGGCNPATSTTQKCPCPPCPAYDSVDTSKTTSSCNCAGLALRTYAYVGLADLKSALGAALKDCSTKCAACQVKFWLWEWDPWSLEFKDKKGKVWTQMKMPPDFHVVSGRCDNQGNDPGSIYSKNGRRPLEGPSSPSAWRVKTGDVWTENAPTNRPIYYLVTAAQIASTKGLDANDLYLGSTISSGMDLTTGKDVEAGERYLKCLVNITDVQTCYCKSC